MMGKNANITSIFKKKSMNLIDFYNKKTSSVNKGGALARLSVLSPITT